MRHIFTVLHAGDESLGRVDFASLSQQNLMEMLVGDINARKMFHDSDGFFLDETEWMGVRCDLYGTVESIKWSNMHDSFFTDGGTIHLEWLPSTVQSFDIYRNHLFGRVDLTRLPAPMKLLILSVNRLEGAADFTALPREMQYLYLSNNSLCGSVNIENLPSSLLEIDASSNTLSGSLDLTSVFYGIKTLNLAGNKLSGDVRISFLPGSIQSVDLSRNDSLQVVSALGSIISDYRITT